MAPRKKQETKDGLPVKKMTKKQFEQAVAEGQQQPVDELAIEPVQPMELIDRLSTIIAGMTTQSAISGLSMQQLDGKARQALAQRNGAIADAVAEEQRMQRQIGLHQQVLIALKARVKDRPHATAQELIEGGNGWAPLPIAQLLGDEGER